jgi:Flavin-binding monooxygenase-like
MELKTTIDVSENLEAVVSAWLSSFETALTRSSPPDLTSVMVENCYWRDVLSFTWDYRTFAGVEAVRRALGDTVHQVRPCNFRISPVRMKPRLGKRRDAPTLDGFFDFDTSLGIGNGFVRLDIGNVEKPRALLLLTTLHQLRGYEDKVGTRRKSGLQYSRNFTGDNWLDTRTKEQAYGDRNPQVLIVGGGQSGLAIAARLKQMDVDCLIIEKYPRIGDNWRFRYHSLTLHNEVWANSLPYFPFPDTWPTFLPKDKLAGWLEAYADFMELNVWTGTKFLGAEYDESNGQWEARVERPGGKLQTLVVPHIVLAIGAAAGAPYKPELPGLGEFKGKTLHSSAFTSGNDYAGQSVIVVGTGNSGHDVAQEAYSNGAKSVTMVQRNPTTVVSLVPGGTLVYAIYTQGPVEDMDLVSLSTPLPLLIESCQRLTRRTREIDKELLERLAKAGFEVDFGEDETGFYLKHMRRGGGYYIDVGCSDLIADQKIDLVNWRDVGRFTSTGMKMRDGRIIACDAVILATGYENLQKTLGRLLGHEVADKVGRIWGLNDDGFLRNMWIRTEQPGLWIMGGSLVDARLYSRFLALQIRADLNGLLPQRKQLGRVGETV